MKRLDTIGISMREILDGDKNLAVVRFTPFYKQLSNRGTIMRSHPGD